MLFILLLVVPILISIWEIRYVAKRENLGIYCYQSVSLEKFLACLPMSCLKKVDKFKVHWTPYRREFIKWVFRLAPCLLPCTFVC